MDRKTFAPVELKLSETGQITLAFAQLNVIDKDGDVTLPGAIPTKEVPMSGYGHTSWDGALPVGRGSIKEAGGWGVFDGAFFMDTDQGRNAYLTVKAMGDLQEYSYGYRPKAGGAERGQFDGQSVRFLKALDIWEVSPVLKGAGVATGTLAIKSGGPDPDLPYAEHVVWVLDQVKALVDRTSDRAELRLTEGRTLSGATLDQLSAIHDQITAAAGGIGDFLAAQQPPPKADERLAREIEILVSRARARGVKI